MVRVISIFLRETLKDNEYQKIFTDLYKQCHRKMQRTAFRILNNQYEAEDAVQNAFIQIICNFEKMQMIPSNELPFWCCSIAKNEARMIQRKRRYTTSIEDCNSYEKSSDDLPSYIELTDLFNHLPERYRIVLELKFIYGYTDQEVAQYLGISKTAVSTRATRGRILLRNLLERG